MAGALLLFFVVVPVLFELVHGDPAESLGIAVMSAPLLAWLLVPLGRSDDLFDEAHRRRTEFVDALAVVLLWTWPWTMLVPLAAVGNFLRVVCRCGE